MKILWIIFTLAAAASVWVAAKATQAWPKLVATEDGRTRMLVAGGGGPVVVLDTFGEMPLDYWGTIQWRCAKFSRVVTYDHRSTGGSDPGPKPRDARQIAIELHAVLHAAHLPPPYVLVGYSFGGPYTREFAGLYPQEVSGMVLIDPSQEEFFDWLKLHYRFVNWISPERAAEQDEFGCTWRSLDEVRDGRLPIVPITLISAIRPFTALDPKLFPQWQAAHEHWLSQIPGSQHIITKLSDHGIIWEEPDLVVRTIREVVNRARGEPVILDHGN